MMPPVSHRTMFHVGRDCVSRGDISTIYHQTLLSTNSQQNVPKGIEVGGRIDRRGVMFGERFITTNHRFVRANPSFLAKQTFAVPPNLLQRQGTPMQILSQLPKALLDRVFDRRSLKGLDLRGSRISRSLHRLLTLAVRRKERLQNLVDVLWFSLFL